MLTVRFAQLAVSMDWFAAGSPLHAVFPVALSYEPMVQWAFLALLRRHPPPPMAGRAQSAV